MTEAKHTPGPWTIEEYGDDETPRLVIHKDSESRVCFMATPGSHGDPAVIEADARLIAAAPELSAFAEAVLIARIEGDEGYLLLKFDGRQIARIQAACPAGIALLKMEAARRAAIAKATV